MMFLALVIGSLMAMAFVFLFGVSNPRLQLTMTGLVAGCMGLLFGIIVEFNSPYSAQRYSSKHRPAWLRGSTYG